MRQRTRPGLPGAQERWKQMTLEANALFHRGELPLALRLYEQARVLSLERYGEWPCADDGVAAVVVSHLNLADAQASDGLLREAAASLCGVHASLLNVTRNAELATSLREAARRHLRQTLAALARFQTEHRERPDVQRWLCRALDDTPCDDPARENDTAGMRATLH